jgi:hypothetical protein
MSERESTAFEPIILRFPHSKDDLRRITVKDDAGEYDVYRISPVAAHWPAELVPDGVNPRSHDENSLTSKVAQDIEKTLRDEPQEFWLANRGGFLLADRVRFDPERGQLEVHLTDEDLHGMADGATSNAIIAKLRKEHHLTKDALLGESLLGARFNMDVVVGLNDRERVAKLVQGRNRSVQVKEWSLADFRGNFDWLKNYIDRTGGPFNGKIGWQENAQSPTSVLDLISIMTLFHNSYSDRPGRRRGAPTAAFASKGTADKRLLDPAMLAGYKALEPVLDEILRLHDFIYVNFQPTYEVYNLEVNGKGSRLGARRGVDTKSTTLPLTGMVSEYRVDKGLLFPLLAAHRALLHYPNGVAEWRTNPFEFFKEYGPDLMGKLFDEYEKLGKQPAQVGKNRSAYENLYEKAENLYVRSTLLTAAERKPEPVAAV